MILNRQGYNNVFLGAVVGDIVGSYYESNPTKDINFPLFKESARFTDDTILTLAVAKWLMEDQNHCKDNLIKKYIEICLKYPRQGYGWNFWRWIRSSEHMPYNSYANGSAMRVSPVGLYASSIDEALNLAKISAEVTHNHPDGIRGAQAIAASVFLCKNGESKEYIRTFIENTFGYDLHRTISAIRPTYKFDVSCNGSVPEAIIAFLDGNSFEEVIRMAISLGGDADTLAAMAGSIASCCYTIPDGVVDFCNNILTDDLKEIQSDFLLSLKL